MKKLLFILNLKKIKLVLILLCLPIFIYSQTNISGIINNNQVWTISGSPYIITNNVLITTGAELQINPGVIIKFNSGNSLQVQGVLKAHGSSTNKIIFTSNDSLPSSGDWGVIEFMDQTIDASYDTLGQYIDGSCIINTNIRYGGGFSAQGAVSIILYII